MYEILEHSADEKFHAEADTKEEALKQVVKAFSEIVGGDVEGMYTHELEVESESLEALVYDFLDRLIFLQETEQVAVSHAEDLILEELDKGWKIRTNIEVDNITSDMNLLDIKAPTYNEMKIEYEDSKWVIEAVLDV